MKSNDENLDDLLKSMEDFGNNGDFIENDNSEDESRPMSALEKLMAEMQSEDEEGFSDIEPQGMLTEDGINMLLDSGDTFSGSELGMASGDDVTADIDMSEIEALLSMTEDSSYPEGGDSFEQTTPQSGIEEVYVEEEEILELDPAELDALLSANIPGTDDSNSGEKDTKKNKLFGGSGDKSEGKNVSKEKKSGGLFGKLFTILMEEIPEDVPEEAATLNLSEENKEILNDLDKEKAKKSKKKDKKAKKEKDEKEKKVKPKKEKKVKPKKEKKPKEEKVAFKPEKRLPRKKVVVTFAFAFSVLAAILIVEFVLPPILSTASARQSFNKGEYKIAFQEYYGKKLSEEDEVKFQGAKTIMRMQSNLDGYHSYFAIEDKVMALHSLLEGVYIKDDVFTKAQVYGVTSQVQIVYNEILNLLDTTFGLSEEDAIQLTNEKSDVVYTKNLHAITGGEQIELNESAPEETVEQVETEVEQISQEDLLPEEMELLQGGE